MIIEENGFNVEDVHLRLLELHVNNYYIDKDVAYLIEYAFNLCSAKYSKKFQLNKKNGIIMIITLVRRLKVYFI